MVLVILADVATAPLLIGQLSSEATNPEAAECEEGCAPPTFLLAVCGWVKCPVVCLAARFYCSRNSTPVALEADDPHRTILLPTTLTGCSKVELRHRLDDDSMSAALLPAGITVNKISSELVPRSSIVSGVTKRDLFLSHPFGCWHGPPPWRRSLMVTGHHVQGVPVCLRIVV